MRELADGPGVVIVAGRFEGVDERVIAARRLEEVSVGDYVLSGGEIAAMALLDAVVRLLPGVMGNAESAASESFAGGLLEYPQYTRPQIARAGRSPRSSFPATTAGSPPGAAPRPADHPRAPAGPSTRGTGAGRGRCARETGDFGVRESTKHFD